MHFQARTFYTSALSISIDHPARLIMESSISSISCDIHTERSVLLRFWQRVRFVLCIVLFCGPLLASASGAYGQTTSLDFDDTRDLEAVGDVIERIQNNVKRLRTAGIEKTQRINTSLKRLVLIFYNLLTRDYVTLSLSPPNNPDASGGGQNISRDGNCIVGFQDAGFSTPFHAVRWTEANGSADLGTLDSANNASRSSFAADTNQDCSVVVGFSDVTAGGATQHGFRWTSNGMVDLGTPPNGGPNSRAFGVSIDGTVIVGDADFPAGAFTRKGAFRWTGGSFTDLIPGTTPSLATAVSADGTVIVGQVGTSTASSAFRWTTQNSTMQPIGPLPGHTTASAIAVSDNGKIIAGISHPTFLQYQGPVLGWNPGTAFRWTATGIKDLRQILSDSGVDMTGITLVSVTGMSPDGQWIQGAATTLQTGPGETVSYIAQVCDDDIGGPCSTSGGGSAPFTLGAGPTQLTVSAGQSASTTITLTPNAGFSQPVNFSCGGLPVGASCSFNPASVTPAGGPINTILTITTNGGPVALLPSSASSTMFAFALTPFVFLPIGILLRRQPSGHRLFSIMAGFVATLTLAGMLSCSSSDSPSPPPTTNSGGSPANGTPAGTSNVTVTATSGSSSSGVPVALTVTRP